MLTYQVPVGLLIFCLTPPRKQVIFHSMTNPTVSQSSRRQFIQASSAVAAASLIQSPKAFSSTNNAASAKKQWYKGNLHMHNQWSDGNPLAEWAVDWYKSNGYHFICPSDHNIFQSDELRFDGFGFNNTPSDLSAFQGETSLWKVISPQTGWPKMIQKFVDESIAKFGEASVRRIKVGDQTYVRMTPYNELEKQFAEPGKFLMIPGFEQTGRCKSGQEIHMNFINVREAFPYISADSPENTLKQNYDRGEELYKDENYLFTANHPLWRYYDYSPNELIALPQIRIFELNNNNVVGNYDPHPQGWKPEKFWDVVNAYRASHGQQLLLAMGSDDRHNYESAPKGWSVVRSEDLSANNILNAMREGDFYASNGLDFEDIQFDGKTLAVKIDVREEAKYRIEFIGTKKDYDPKSQVIETKDGPKQAARKIDVYSDSIGVVLETVEGTEGSYTLKNDDLYVRAKIVKVTEDLRRDWESAPAAWTQPYN